MGSSRQIKRHARCTKNSFGQGRIAGALLGGPIGMTGYVLAINNIGAAYTAIISAFYPAVGAFLSFVLLKEKWAKDRFFPFSLLFAA